MNHHLRSTSSSILWLPNKAVISDFGGNEDVKNVTYYNVTLCNYGVTSAIVVLVSPARWRFGQSQRHLQGIRNTSAVSLYFDRDIYPESILRYFNTVMCLLNVYFGRNLELFGQKTPHSEHLGPFRRAEASCVPLPVFRFCKRVLLRFFTKISRYI